MTKEKIARRDLERARTRKHMWAEAVAFTKKLLEDQGVTEQVRDSWVADPKGWWAAHHFGTGMKVRNALRDEGFGEKDFRISNLDNVWVVLVEEAAGVGEKVAT